MHNMCDNMSRLIESSVHFLVPRNEFCDIFTGDYNYVPTDISILVKTATIKDVNEGGWVRQKTTVVGSHLLV
jgi:hypothetical protein